MHGIYARNQMGHLLRQLRGVIAQGGARGANEFTRNCAAYMARVLGRDIVRLSREASSC